MISCSGLNGQGFLEFLAQNLYNTIGYIMLQKIHNYKLIIALVSSLLVTSFVLPLLQVSEASASFNMPTSQARDGQGQTEAWQLEGANRVAGLKDSNLNREFNLLIPKIGLQQQVVENVHPGNEAVYGPVIEQYIAHGLYTRLPDEATVDGNVYLFAHREGRQGSRDFGYFRNLDQLQAGDQAQIRYAGKTYTYTLYSAFVITPQDTWVYTDESEFPTLTLQTCENGDKLRLILKFRLVSVS